MQRFLGRLVHFLTGHEGRVHFTRMEEGWEVFFFAVVAVAAAFLIWQFYKKEPDFVSRRKKLLLTALRSLGVLVVLFVLTGPVVEVEKTTAGRSTCVVLVDTSLSMSFKDRRVRQDDIGRARRILGEERADPSRFELVRAALANPEFAFIDSIAGKGMDFRVFTFGSRLSEADLGEEGGLPEDVSPQGESTRLGAALREVARRTKGVYLAGVVAFTDGGQNRGEDPVLAATDAGLRVFPAGVGLPQAKDIQVNHIFAEDVVFTDDEVPVYVRVRQTGYTGDTAVLVVKEGDSEVAGEEIKFSAREETFELSFTPRRTGKLVLTAGVNPKADEMTYDNNFKKKPLKVIADKMQILVVEAAPRYEYRYLVNALRRDRRVSFKLCQTSADPELSEAGGEYLDHFPDMREDLFKFDLVVLGNMPSDYFSDRELELLHDFVDKEGGALWVICGMNEMPDSYAGREARTEAGASFKFTDLLPFEFEEQPPVDFEDEVQSPLAERDAFVVKLSPDGKRHPALRIHPDPETSASLWEDATEVYWFYRAERLKPAATALLVHPTESGSKGPFPLLAFGRYGRGRVMASLVDETWRMRYLPGPEYHDRLLRQLAQFLALPHVLGESRRVQLATDRHEYGLGEKVEITARILDSSYNPLAEESVSAAVRTGEMAAKKVLLASDRSRPGFFKSEFVPDVKGEHKVVIEGYEDEAEAEFSVVFKHIEFEDPGMREELLERLARESGGKFFRLDEIGEIAAELAARRREIPVKREFSLWDKWIFVVLFTALFGAEWFIRKRADLC